MITNALLRWLQNKWRPPVETGDQAERAIAFAYHATFGSLHGQIVLQHLMDNVYCTVYEGNDSILATAHNARRSVVHEILVRIDQGEHPLKYEVQMETEDGSRG
jgi:hypothetical protein